MQRNIKNHSRSNQNNLPAVLGGPPLFDQAFHLVRPQMPNPLELVKDLNHLYNSRILSNQGIYCQELESDIAKMTGRKYCALFSSGTMAIMCLFQAMEFKGEVLLPSFTFAATSQALLWLRLKIKFIDIDPNTLMMDPTKTIEAISKNTAALFPVNLFGRCCDLEAFSKISNQYNIPLFFDSAQAFGSKYKGKEVGEFGDAQIFSFHATKFFQMGEGGAVITDSHELYEKLYRIRNFGFKEYLNCVELGINGKMSEFSAMIGRRLLKNIPLFMTSNMTIFNHYQKRLKELPGITIPSVNKNQNPNYSYFPILVDPYKYGLTNLELNYALYHENIISRCYFFPPVHRTLYYQNRFRKVKFNLPNTDWAGKRVICLPIHADMKIVDIDKIISGIFECHRNARKIKKAISGKVPHSWKDVKSGQMDDPYNKIIKL